MKEADMTRADRDGAPPGSAAPEWAAMHSALLELDVPEQVEAALLQAFGEQQRQRNRGRRWRLADLTGWLSVGAVSAMAALLVLGLYQGPAPLTQAALVEAEYQHGGFVPLAEISAAQLASAQPQLMSTSLSRSTLVAMGIPIADNAPDELIRADLLVAASGEALAVRLSLN